MATASLLLPQVVNAGVVAARVPVLKETKPHVTASVSQARSKPLTVCSAAPVSTFFVTHSDEAEPITDLSLLPLADSADVTILHLGEGISLPDLPHVEGEEDVAGFPPTPVLPSGAMMAEFLTAYRRMLEHEAGSGDKAAAAGEGVLQRIKIGLMALLGHPKHGAFAGMQWHKLASDLETCLDELDKDMALMHRYHEKQPTRLALQMTSLHCDEAARILRRL